MKLKMFATVSLLTLILVGVAHTSAEARHHRRSSFGIGFAVTDVAPAPVYVAQPVYYAPVYAAPVVVNQPVVYPAPVVREVYVAPRVPVYRQAGFSWFFGW